jgi:hypothetical protein
MQKANWNFFCLAGAIRTSVFWRRWTENCTPSSDPGTCEIDGKQFNSLEITGVVEKLFLGIAFLSATANSRDIQESVYVVPMENRASTMTVAVAPSETPCRGEVLAKQQRSFSEALGNFVEIRK